ncbi:hypothetical protein P7D85_07100 [Enterococcus hulanensis]|uniref:Uncharacterized protein n=1 Tax=Enterococcus hulanensis TaxID=2559929 RepID=A0ABU3EXY5_9ENTE|nr:MULTISPECIES: hypothetical protein [Enterococcus]MBO0410797.1 hypothetical protein [Enterococcus hulanensis]MDT2599537.1 hypothetical protein [Enterococcus hulanensis]MDT2609607.1 hypothetical protein [Enterococcus hulanensis]MDT2616184.1 hypothetical protein [Enterococcus hulanensis]MDT2627776.1 hypothetical protein [Enterococcus hulanensis]
MQTYSRKKSRFPAFDDEAGVKLVQTNQRVLFDGQDDLITSYRLEAKDIFERPMPKTKRTRRVNLDEEPRRELDHHKANLPMYQGERKESKKVKLFEEHKPKESAKPKSTFNTRNGRSATPFSPKFVPSSLIPDEPADAISPRELMQRMEKSRQSYILFAPENEQKQPAIERKNSRQRLDRSLRGIMQEENSSIENSKYFHD